MAWANWLKQLFASRENRRSPRVRTDTLSAYYWNGDLPTPHKLRDISWTGAYVLTDEHWYVGTAMHIVLQHHRTENEPENGSFGVWTRVVRADPCGMGIEFLFTNRGERLGFRRFLEVIQGMSPS